MAAVAVVAAAALTACSAPPTATPPTATPPTTRPETASSYYLALGDSLSQAAVPGIGSVPRNVARICQWTWECASPPRGPNQHANAAGYRVIANAILAGISGP